TTKRLASTQPFLVAITTPQATTVLPQADAPKPHIRARLSGLIAPMLISPQQTPTNSPSVQEMASTSTEMQAKPNPCPLVRTTAITPLLLGPASMLAVYSKQALM